jgi:hypothetical protein
MTEQPVLNTTTPSSNLGRKLVEGGLLALVCFGPRNTEPHLPVESPQPVEVTEAANNPQPPAQHTEERTPVEDQSSRLDLSSLPAQPEPSTEMLAPSVDLTLRLRSALPDDPTVQNAHALLATPDQLSAALAEIQRSGETIKEIVLVNGEPLLNDKGEVLPESSSIFPWAPQIADAPGHFVLSTREPGNYYIVVYGEGFITHVEPPIELIKGERRQREIWLSPAQDLSGFLFDADTGAPVHNARVLLTPNEVVAHALETPDTIADQASNHTGLARAKVTESDVLGEFKFQGLHLGPANLIISAEGYVADFRALELGSDNSLIVNLQPERKVTLQLINAHTNKPFIGARCNGFLLQEFAGQIHTSILPGYLTNDNGDVAIGGISPDQKLEKGAEQGDVQVYILELYDPSPNVSTQDSKQTLPMAFTAKELIDLEQAGKPLALTPITSNKIILRTKTDIPAENEKFWINAVQVSENSTTQEITSWLLTDLQEPGSPSERRFLYAPRWVKYSDKPTEIILEVYRGAKVLKTLSLGAPGTLNADDVYIDL